MKKKKAACEAHFKTCFDCNTKTDATEKKECFRKLLDTVDNNKGPELDQCCAQWEKHHPDGYADYFLIK